jgi:hypothetical protein
VKETGNYEINTVELVQSDIWVFQHPVTSDKNLWSQSISVQSESKPMIW